MASWTKISMVILLVVQAYISCAALNAPKAGWVTKHLQRPDGLKTRTDRHLTEKTASNGWRTTLIPPNYRGEVEKLTVLEMIRRDVETSKERARFLDLRSRSAPYKRNKGRRMLEDFVSKIQGTPGGYSMEISIGTPPQTFVALADTGSDLVWLQCSPCEICFDSTSNFDPSVSTSYQTQGCGPTCDALGNNKQSCDPTCQYTYLYGDQSTTLGDFSLETVTLQNVGGSATTSVTGFEFGCGRRNNGTFSGTSGIVGLARGPISFTSQIAKYLNSNKFSYCLLSSYDPDSARSPIYFGDAAVPSNSTISETALLSPYDPAVVPYYYVSLRDISFGGSPLSIPSSAFEIDQKTGNGGVIFDSGTTYTVLDTVAYQSVKTAFKNSLDSVYTPVDASDLTGLEVCYDISAEIDTVSIPSLTFNFAGADFNLSFDNIMILFTIRGAGDYYMCLALLESSGLNIYGNVQQQNFQVLYDVDNEKIGWVGVDCKSL
ncbi:hypothetical protein R1flu_002901 [Riccia fluitans]|uniref:Peptidase A1 domain-containing protein n=1 Tax=Riccia fluitans TaxID=41844 RepID=A0ABD1Y7T3_9MARC